MNQAVSFDRFLTALHRRFVVIRALERAGLGLLCGGLAALPLLPLLILRGEPTLHLVLASLGIGTAAGLLWGIMQRPSALQAATEADRQLHLADLLSSALLVRTDAAGDTWAQTVVALADARSATLRPAHVMLNRWGARAWSGTGLATALLLSITTVSLRSTSTRATGALTGLETKAPANDSVDDRPVLMLSASRPPHAEPPPALETSNPSESEDHRSATDKHLHVTGEQPHANRDTRSGDGSSSASTDPPGSLPPIPDSGTSAESESHEGSPGAGTGNPAHDPSKAGTSSTSAGAGKASPRTPPWQSASWSADVRRAHESIERGDVPDTVRDLLREYFDRP